MYASKYLLYFYYFQVSNAVVIHDLFQPCFWRFADFTEFELQSSPSLSSYRKSNALTDRRHLNNENEGGRKLHCKYCN